MLNKCVADTTPQGKTTTMRPQPVTELTQQENMPAEPEPAHCMSTHCMSAHCTTVQHNPTLQAQVPCNTPWQGYHNKQPSAAGHPPSASTTAVQHKDPLCTHSYHAYHPHNLITTTMQHTATVPAQLPCTQLHPVTACLQDTRSILAQH
jgi:hypothetical protein